MSESSTPTPGATAAAEPLAGVARDHGDAAAEYAAVRSGAGVADRDDLGIVELTGRDPVRMVQGLITGDLEGAGEERAVYSVLLTPKGRTIAELRALKMSDGDRTKVWLLVPREVFADATDHFRRFVPPMYARWRDASDDQAVLGVYGRRSTELLQMVLGDGVADLAEDEVACVELGDETIRMVGTRDAGGEVGFELLLTQAQREELRSRLLEAGDGWAKRVGFDALELLRVEAGRPRGGHELTQQSIPTEAFESTGLMDRAISFTKGCYTGQEVIVRIAHRGHVNRLLRGLVLEPEAAISAGDRIHHPENGKDVGWITSVARSPLLGSPIAMAYVRRELEPGEKVLVGEADGPPARIVALPFRANI